MAVNMSHTSLHVQLVHDNISDNNVTNVAQFNTTTAKLWGTEDDYLNPFDLLYVRVIFIVLYSLIAAACLVGNTLVILVILQHERMRTVTNFFLANLAFSDLCVGLFCVIPSLLLNLMLEWHLGQIMCKLFYYIQATSYTASITIMVAIAFERYFVIVHPMRSKHLATPCLLRIIILLIWAGSAAYSLPYLIIADVIEVPVLPGYNATYCFPVNEIDMKSYVTINFGLCYLLPLACITIIYAQISVTLWKSSNHLEPLLNPPKKEHNLLQNLCVKTCKWRKGNAPGTDDSTDEKKTQYSRASPSQPGGPSFTIPSISTVDTEQESIPMIKCDGVMAEHPKNNELEVDEKQNHGTTYDLSKLTVDRADTIRKMQSLGESPKVQTSRFGRPSVVVLPKTHALRSRRKVIRLLMAIVVAFGVSVLPYHVRILWQEWGEPDINLTTSILSPASMIVYYSTCSMNPILYAFLSDQFKRCLRETLPCSVERGSTT